MPEKKSQGVWNTVIQGACVQQRQRRKAETATARDHWVGSILKKIRSIRHKRKEEKGLMSG